MKLSQYFVSAVLCCVAFVAIANEASLRVRPDMFDITRAGPGIAYGIAGNVYYDDPTYPPHTNFVVGAQLNAHAMPGSHQNVWGIATEAWAHPNSRSVLIGNESTTINMEPSNSLTKSAYFATFKNRPDGEYQNPPADPMNTSSIALLIESQPGTGFERGIVFRQHSLYPSIKEPKPIAIDYQDIPMEAMREIILTRFPDGWCEFYVGGGRKIMRPCLPEEPLDRIDALNR